MRNIEIRICLRFVGIRKLYVCRDNLSWIKAWIFLQQIPQRTQQQAGSHHQYDGERQFRDD